MIVVLSDAAERDLEAIAEHIAAESPRRALSFLQELRQSCLELSLFPERFPLVARYEDRGVRRSVHGRYLIFYLVEANRVVVLHVLAGAMDYEPILFPDLT